MDFNKFDSVAAAEKGAEMHIKHPVSQKPLYDNSKDPTKDNGKPCIVVLLGGEAPTVRSANREIQKTRAAAKPKTDKTEGDQEDNINLDDLHDQMVETILPRVVGFKNVRNGSKAATKDDAEWFFNLNRFNGQPDERSFVEQAGDFSSKRESYLGNASKG